ncbi:MAG TPA: Re/Si-specific NAD(P)(+) transhydrogenase subunit alpha [Gemmataceae bacterium]|jgi:NAD(P) transhydrogenase subunit alpha|nr:Re/Si-specific NAD(P)(+) transhydrogenase subunit alpha [Gemmataceae bacterium]
MLVGVPRETATGETRVALVPDLVPPLRKAGLDVVVENGAGAMAGFPDAAFEQAGATRAAEALANADFVLKVNPPAPEEIDRFRTGAVLIGFLNPTGDRSRLEALAGRNVSAFAMERMPRITRAQPMDALSAMSTVAGYKAVLLAANHLPKFFPLLMTAAGTIQPARVLIIGAGVAGLQAIATARRLGAVVEAYDTRPAVREQVESLGGKFVDLGLDTGDAEAKTGYAKAQSEEFYNRQRQALGEFVSRSDAVITTALVPGQRAPLLITEDAVRAMRPGSVIVDLAAEQGGNCAVTKPGENAVVHGVTILGPRNLPALLPYHASQMYARTVTSYLLHLFKNKALNIDLGDDLTKGPLVTHQGKVMI